MFLIACRVFQGTTVGQQRWFSRDVQEDLRYPLRAERVRLHGLFPGAGELLREGNGEYPPSLPFPPLEFDYLDVKMAQLRFISLFAENSVYKVGSRSIYVRRQRLRCSAALGIREREMPPNRPTRITGKFGIMAPVTG